MRIGSSRWAPFFGPWPLLLLNKAARGPGVRGRGSGRLSQRERGLDSEHGGRRIRVTFLPEFSVVIPGLITRPLIKPGVVQQISLASVAGRAWSQAVLTFARAVETFLWYQAPLQQGA